MIRFKNNDTNKMIHVEPGSFMHELCEGDTDTWTRMDDEPEPEVIVAEVPVQPEPEPAAEVDPPDAPAAPKNRK